MPVRTALEEILDAQFQQREMRAEQWSCLFFAASILSVFAIVTLSGQVRVIESYPALKASVTASIVIMSVLALALQKGYWHPVLRFINTGLQVTALSSVLVSLTLEKGPAFSLSTALPMLYCLVISITAFRLSPALSMFAGALSAGELTFIYAAFMRPVISPEMLMENSTLSWSAVLARVLILFAIGAACAIAARSLRGQFKKSGEDQTRIQLLERTFGRLVAPQVARQILEDENWMQPARREAVVMFADLKGFTRYSETKSPEEVATFLNRCWEIAATLVEKHGGVINKYMGDGFLAIFGVPVALPHPEQAAVQTADELEKELAAILEPEGLALCIGLNSGPLIVGGIGSEARCEFTVIGSTVNLASRIESLNRSLDTRCLTSQSVADKIEGNWHLKDHGGHRVKGIADDVGVYELMERKATS